MSANVEAMVREGANAFKAGKRDEARALLTKAVELDPYHEEGWLWLSGAVESPEDQRTCLENVLAINPNNLRAKKGVEYLSGPAVAVSSAPPAPVARATESSVEWGDPADIAAPAPVPPTKEPSPSEYDEWVTGLNLQGFETKAPPPVTAPTPANPFFGYDSDEDAFPPTTATSTAAALPIAPPVSTLATDISDYFTDAEAALPPRRAPAPVNALSFRPPPVDDPFADDLAVPATLPRESLLLDADLDGDGEYFEEGEGELFGFIPREIRATRLPGVRERTPAVYVIGALLLFVFNIGAAVLLAMRFF